jgi:hypothetical protein
MGYSTNYYKLISTLIQWKDEFARVNDKKYTKLIEALKQYTYSDDSDDIPSNKDIAIKMGMPHLKVNVLLKGLIKSLTHDFMINPLKIRDCYQVIHIHIPYNEQNEEIKKKDRNHYFQFSTFTKVCLPFIPRIGEEIRLEYLGYGDKINSGYVHRIEHKINGSFQEIYIEVHPIDNEYARWQKLKEEYERDQAWKRQNRFK